MGLPLHLKTKFPLNSARQKWALIHVPHKVAADFGLSPKGAELSQHSQNGRERDTRLEDASACKQYYIHWELPF